MITKLSPTTIQKISSGQLILDIPSILKELIENSLDANATQIILTLEDEALTSLSVLPLSSSNLYSPLPCPFPSLSNAFNNFYVLEFIVVSG
jgi:hypothetical protein